jgi:hypothetical protein
MNIKIIAGTLFLSLIQSLNSQTPAFSTQRYESLVNRTISSLESRKKLLEEKLKAQQELQSTIQKRKIMVNPARNPQYSAIEEANQSVNAVLEKGIKDLTKRIALLAQDKNTNLKRGIKDAAEELNLIKKTNLQQTVADLESQLEQSRTAAAFVARQRTISSTNQPIDTLANTWARQQTQLEIKLQRARSELASLR